MTRRKKIRSVRFGLRTKFSLIMVGTVVFVALMIGLVSFTQYNKKIREEIRRLGTTILNGTKEDAGMYLRNLGRLRNPSSRQLSAYEKYTINRAASKSLKTMADYFSSIIIKENILDIAYCIAVNWHDVNVDWRGKYTAEYIYFSRARGTILQRGWNDKHLKPSVFSHYMRHCDTGTFMTYSDGGEAGSENFVILGLPVFDEVPVRIDGQAEGLYASYTHFIDYWHGPAGTGRPSMDSDELERYNNRLRVYEQLFLKRLADNLTSIDYTLILDSDEKISMLSYFLAHEIFFQRTPRAGRKQIWTDIGSSIKNALKKQTLRLNDLKKLMHVIMRSKRAVFRTADDEKETWRRLYYFSARNNIETRSTVSLEELALISFRRDLRGIIGIYLHRSQFFSEMRDHANEMVNLIISIVIRCIIIALFFPTFIIRTVSKLAAGAGEIGRGNLDYRLDIPGNDELGRLSDIFNIMGANLKKAQAEMLEKRRMESELETAREIQSALLPKEHPKSKHMGFGAHYAAQTEASGDYYDFIELDGNRLGIAVADVSGHGVGSGLVMAMTRTLLHTYCRSESGPLETLVRINRYLYENTADTYFVSMFYGILDINSLKMTYSCAGHMPGLVLRGNRIEELAAGGIALGAVPEDIFIKLGRNHSVSLRQGDCFVQYTDGVIEAMDENKNEFGMERFHAALMKNSNRSAQGIIDSVINVIHDFTGRTPQHDDMTIIALRIL